MLISRRGFLGHLLLPITAGTLAQKILGSNSPLPGAIRARYAPVPFSTALSIAQFALGAGKLFQGSSSSGVSTIQIKMLQNISNQLEVMQREIVLILSDLEKIKEAIGEIPAATVQELKQMELQGNISHYDELMQTFVRYRLNSREFLRDQARKKELDELLVKIRSNRTTLTNYTQYLHVPVLSSAAYMEFNCLQMLGDSPLRIAEAMTAYARYFKRVLFEGEGSLVKQIERIRTDRQTLLSKARNPKGIEAHIFNPRADYGFHFFVTADTNTDVSFKKDETGGYEQNERVGELIKLGLITNDERWVSLKSTYSPIMSGNHTTIVATPTRLTLDPSLQTLMGNPRGITSLPTFSAAVEQLNTSTTALEREINLATNRLYSSTSCYFAGNRALNFCLQFA